MIVLPCQPGAARYNFQCDLDGSSFTFSFEFNDRDSGWYMSIADVNQTPLLLGRRIVLNYPLINIYRAAGLPAGDIVAFDSTGKNIEPDLLDLGDRVALCYIPFAELAGGF